GRPARAPLGARIEADVCIIGCGLAGLTTAQHLVRAGRKVVLIEAQRVGWGASGRNGGFVSPGYALGYAGIAKKTGTKDANELHRMSIEGVQIVADNIKAFGISAAAPCSGILGAV